MPANSTFEHENCGQLWRWLWFHLVGCLLVTKVEESAMRGDQLPTGPRPPTKPEKRTEGTSYSLCTIVERTCSAVSLGASEIKAQPMTSPFPGMDPHIEDRGLWPDFHSKLIGEIERKLAAALLERYFVQTGER